MADLNLDEGAEHRIVSQHWELRQATGIVGWHTPNGEKRDKVTGAKLKAMMVLPGIPDFLFLTNGGLYGIELKRRRKGVLSKSQKITIANMREAGATIVVARGADEALDQMEAWGFIKGSRWGIAVAGIRGFKGHPSIRVAA